MSDRIAKFRKQLQSLKIDGIIITSPENCCYLSGFTGTAGALAISDTIGSLITDSRFWEQAEGEAPEWTLYKQTGPLWPNLLALLDNLKWRRVGFEANSLTFQEYRTLTDQAPKDWEWVPFSGLVESLRATKEPEEIQLLTKAAAITDLAWEKTLSLIKPGLTEADIALEFDYQLRRNGASGSAFSTIVASGWRAALPHAAPSTKILASGELVLLDGGALYQGYHADFTRTVVLGKATARQNRIYQTVLEAQMKALDFLKAGSYGKEVDLVARGYIAEAGFGDNFGHGLGHSVGLQIHENPRLSPSETGIIPAGAAVTVEPGIYLKDWGGVRIEDLVVVTEDGVQILTSAPKNELLEL